MRARWWKRAQFFDLGVLRQAPKSHTDYRSLWRDFLRFPAPQHWAWPSPERLEVNIDFVGSNIGDRADACARHGV